MGLRQPNLLERAREPEPMDEPEQERDERGPAARERAALLQRFGRD